jgi:phosphatidate cytidylyltransferase
MLVQNLGLLSTVIVALLVATFGGEWLRRLDPTAVDRRTVEAFNSRVYAWWFFTAVMALGFLAPGLTVLLFGLLSFWALREFVTLTPTRIGDHRALFWVFFFFTPLQFVLIYLSQWWDLYGLFSILIPVYGFLFIAARAAASDDYDRFLERVAKVQCGLMVCVYCLSYAPALLFLNLREVNDRHASARLLFFFVAMALVADLLQQLWSRIYRRHIVAPKIDPNLSWEGILAGAGSTAALGLLLAWAAPFPHWWQTAAMAFLVAGLAAAGSVTMAAIKRDRGEGAVGPFFEGHNGVLDHIDGLCFASPIFYHLSRYFFGA